MKIMHFAGGGDIGGAKTHILSLGQKLSAHNEFYLVSFRAGAFAEEAKALGLQVIVVEHAWDLISCLRVALQAVDRYQPDVIHCHGAKANMIGVLVKKLRHKPLLTTVHSDPKRDYMGTPIKQAIFGSINAWALRRMDYYMAVAGRMETNLIENGVDPQRIFVIHNGLDFAAASDTPRPIPVADADIVVGIAARLTPIKNIATLLRAFALAWQKNPRLRLKIAGIGEEQEDLKALAERLHIQDRVDFVGWVTDMREFFSGVDINVLSSLSETFPYSLLEGAYQHCAAIASSVGGIPELIEHEETGLLFSPLDVETFADHIYRLSVDDALRQTMAERLYCRAREQFSLEHMRETQEAAYRTVLRRSRDEMARHGAVICGAYGRGNAGDEAILQSIVAQMREIDPDMRLTVMSRDKRQTRLRNKTNAVYTFNVVGFLHHLRHSRLFINGGGSLIQDVTSSRSLYFYLFTLYAARICGCRVIMYGCGIGPVYRARNRRIAARILNRNVEVITLRDSMSAEVLRRMGVDKPQIRLAADPTVNIQRPDAVRIAAAFRRAGIPAEAPKIGFCMRQWPAFDAAAAAAVAAAADHAYEKYGYLPVFLPIELPKDIEAAARVIQYMHAPSHACHDQYAVEDLVGMLGSMRMVIGMRLHSLIFATLGGAPVIGVSYDMKVDSFIHDIGSDACIPVAELTADKLCTEIDRIAAGGCARADAALERLRQGEAVNTQSVRQLLAKED